MGKARSHRVPNLGRRGLSHLGDFMLCQKTLLEAQCMSRHVVVMKLPVAHSFGLLNYPNSFWRGMFNLNAKYDADPLLYLLSCFECDGHTVHVLTQQCLRPPLTSTVRSSLFTHAHSSPLSLAARLHRCWLNCSCYVNNGWTFSIQTSYVMLLRGTREKGQLHIFRIACIKQNIGEKEDGKVGTPVLEYPECRFAKYIGQ